MEADWSQLWQVYCDDIVTATQDYSARGAYPGGCDDCWTSGGIVGQGIIIVVTSYNGPRCYALYALLATVPEYITLMIRILINR